MPIKTIPLLFIFLLNAGDLMLSAEEKPPASQPDPKNTQPQTVSPKGETKSHYFQDSGSQVDGLVNRIHFKISYSWDKSAEYFRLACSSITDNAAAKGRDIKAHADSKKDELLERGKQAVRESTRQAMQNLSGKGEELRQDLNKMGREFKDEASKEVRENTDKFFK